MARGSRRRMLRLPPGDCLVQHENDLLMQRALFGVRDRLQGVVERVRDFI